LKIYSKILVFILILLFVFSSSIDYFFQNNHKNEFFEANYNFTISASITKIDAISSQILSAVEIINILSFQNFNVISNFNLKIKFDIDFKIILNQQQLFYEFYRNIPDLIIRKIIFPFHYFW